MCYKTPQGVYCAAGPLYAVFFIVTMLMKRVALNSTCECMVITKIPMLTFEDGSHGGAAPDKYDWNPPDYCCHRQISIPK